MGNPPRTRKRVHAIRRASNGSAFESCDNCGVSVPIALADMHECEAGNRDNVKRFKGLNRKPFVVQQTISEQPRSPFRLFMEDFMKPCQSLRVADLDRKGFETWKSMSKEERQPYVIRADVINSAYVKSLMLDIDTGLAVDDEADSAMVGRFDAFYEDCGHWEDSDSFYSFKYGDFESFNSWGGDCACLCL